jgi:hypothetical protein
MFIQEMVPLLTDPCPTCGCPVRTANDSPLRQFFSRLAWAQQALGVQLEVTGEFKDGAFMLTRIVPRKGGQ